MQGSLGLVVAAEGGYDGGVVMRRMEMMHVVIVSENHNASDLKGSEGVTIPTGRGIIRLGSLAKREDGGCQCRGRVQH